MLMLLATLLPTSCTDNNEMLAGTDDGKVHWTLSATLPGAENSATRAFGNTNYTFNDLYVAVFVPVDGVYYLDEFVQAENITQVEGQQEWQFEVTLNKTTDGRRLHLIANYPGLTMGFGEEGQLVGRLMANGANPDIYWGCFELSKVDAMTNLSPADQAKLKKIPLVRNYVKIELKDNRSDKTNFTLTGYALYNVPTKGTVAPYNPSSATQKFANFVRTVDGQIVCQTYHNLLDEQKYEGNEPYDDGTLLSKEINWVAPGTPSYIYERSNRKSSNPTCMLIKGTYGGKETYYKLDFVYEENGTNIYYNLLRNFIYTMNINEVNGPGYNSPQEALKQPASNNIGGDVVAKDYTNISNGTGRLFVSKTYMLFTTNKPADLYFKYQPDINDAEPSNGLVTVNAPAGQVLKSAKKAVNNETSGEHNGWRKITLTPNDLDGIAHGQTIVFSAGGLQRSVDLVLREPYNLTVAVNPKMVETGAKKPLTVNITLPSGIAPALFPLKLFISSKDNTIYPDYGTNMPAEAQNGKYGFIREVSLLEYQNSTSYACNFLTNCANSATIVYVDNEYFATGKDNFGNPGMTTVSLATTVAVEVEQIYGLYPKSIYNNGNNNGTESVTATLNGNTVGTITIDRDNVTKGLTIPATNGLLQSDEVVFTFTDNYWHGTWSATPITYKATATLSDIAAGKKLVFTAQGKINGTIEVTIPDNIHVNVQKVYGRYPQNIYNEGSNNGTESVTVSLNDIPLGSDETITINSSEVESGNTFSYPDGVGLDDELTFTFTDKYWLGGDNWKEAEYTATSTLREISEDGTLNFTVKGEIQKLKSITIPTTLEVTVQQENIWYNYYYPFNIHNDGTESVTVSLNDNTLGSSGETITINSSKVTSGKTFSYPAGVGPDDVLTFTFTDKFATSLNYYNNTINWSNENATYTATCKVGDLLNGTATLSFTRNQ